MSEPVIELIAAEFATRLANVTTGNGFQQTLEVQRPSRRGIDTEANNIAVLTQDSPTPDEEVGFHGVGNSFQQWDVNFGVELISRQSDKDDTPAETLVNRVWADCIQAITRFGETDETTWYTFGDNALNASFGRIGGGLGLASRAARSPASC